jgi:hypothetical protein
VREVVGRAVEVFARDLGCEVEEADPGWDNPSEAFWGVVIAECDLVGMRRLAGELGDRMTPHLREVLQQEWTAEQLTDAVVARKAVYNRMWRFMRTYDLLLTPTLAVPPFELGIQGPTVTDGREVDQFDWLAFTFPMNLTGNPAATVPAGFTDDGLPIGLQIVGRTSTIRRSCARPPRSRRRRRGPTAGRRCSTRWGCSRVSYGMTVARASFAQPRHTPSPPCIWFCLVSTSVRAQLAAQSCPATNASDASQLRSMTSVKPTRASWCTAPTVTVEAIPGTAHRRTW